MSNTKQPVALELGRDTIVSVGTIGELVDMPNGSGRIQVDYTVLQRGGLSRRAIKERLQRYFVNLIVIAVGNNPESNGKYRRKMARAKAWNSKHVRAVIDDQLADDAAI